MNLVRRLRGVLVSAAVWAVAFSLVGLVYVAQGAARGLFPPSWAESWISISSLFIVRAMSFGAVAGTVFALTVMVAERRRTFHMLSAKRFALWGFLSATVIPLGLTAAYAASQGTSLNAAILPWAISYGLVGAGIGVATHWLGARGRPDVDSADALPSGEAWPVEGGLRQQARASVPGE